MKHDPHQVLLFHHFRRVLEAAAEQGIDIAPLKGAHLLTSVYPLGEDRGPMADVDFLVREQDWDRTCALLPELGFVRKPTGERPATMIEFHEAGFYLEVGVEYPLLFEPHRQLIQPARHHIDHEALWERSFASEFDGARCRRLAAEDHFLHAVIHLMTDRFIRPKKGLRDMELLLRHEYIDLEVVVSRAVEWQCTRAAWLALVLLHEMAPELGADRLAGRIAPRRHVREVLRFLVPGVQGCRYAGSGLRSEQALVWPWLMDSVVQAVRFGRYYAGLRIRDITRRFLA